MAIIAIWKITIGFLRIIYLKIDQITNFAEIAKCQIIIFVLLCSYLQIAQLLAKSNAQFIFVSVCLVRENLKPRPFTLFCRLVDYLFFGSTGAPTFKLLTNQNPRNVIGQKASAIQCFRKTRKSANLQTSVSGLAQCL